MYKLTTILILTTSTLLLSCAETKKVSAKNQEQKKVENTTEMKSEIKTSAFARLFINDLNKELDKQKKSIENYKPSKELIDKYGIQLFNDEYFIQGFITTNNQLDQTALNQLNITTGKPMGNKMTIRIPVKSFNQFLQIKGIEYFEMNPKSEIK